MSSEVQTKIIIGTSEKDKEVLNTLAKQYRLGNVSDLVRIILLDFIENPKTIKIKPLEKEKLDKISETTVSTTLSSDKIKDLKILSKDIVKLKTLYLLIIENFIEEQPILNINLNDL